MSNVALRSFVGGEIAPSMHARTDMAKYQTGLRQLENLLIQRHGGVTNRSGFEFVEEVADSTETVRLVKFVFNNEQTYLLEFGDKYIRFYNDGARIETPIPAPQHFTGRNYVVGDVVRSSSIFIDINRAFYCIKDHFSSVTNEPLAAEWTIYWIELSGPAIEIITPYAEADLMDLQFVQSADIITITHQSYPVMELRRYGDRNWVIVPVSFGPTIAKPSNLVLGGGIVGGTTFYAVTSVSEATMEESLPTLVSGTDHVPDETTPATLSWDPVSGAIYYNIYRSKSGKAYGLVGQSGGVTSEQTDNTFTDTSETVTNALFGNWESAAGQVRNTVGVSATNKAYNGDYRLTFYSTILPGMGASGPLKSRVKAYYSRDGETRVLAGTYNLNDAWGEDLLGPSETIMTINVPDNGYTTLTIDLVPESYKELFSDPAGDVTVDTISGPSSVKWTTVNLTTFSDNGTEEPSLLDRPPVQPALFDAIDKYPKALTYYQQRLVLANTILEPEKIAASQTGNFKSFATSTPLQDDDAVSWAMAGRQVHEVRFLLDLGRLVVFTSGSEYEILGDENNILRPDAISPKFISSNGIGSLPPIPIVDTALYIQARGTIVRDLKNIGAEGYEGTDLTIYSAHLFDGYTLVDWDYAATPHSTLWIVRSDGILLALTYLREHNIWGWHRHVTDGFVERVCVVPEGSEDRVYIVVKRTIDGEEKRYIERMSSRFFTDIVDAVFMDSALTYNGWNTDGVTTMNLQDGTDWTYDEELTLVRSAGEFTTDDVGNVVVLVQGDDTIRVRIDAFVSATEVTVFAEATVPASLRGPTTTEWALAVDVVGGLEHLEGREVSILGDGFVVSSPNNEDYPTLSVSAGEVTLDRCYAVIHVGLPYMSDFETLDLDTAQGPSLKDKRMIVNKVNLMVEQSRGIWIGPKEPTGTDPLEDLAEVKPREAEEAGQPPELVTDTVEVVIENNWSKHGRIFVRQVDPLPLTILAAIPQGFIP